MQCVAHHAKLLLPDIAGQVVEFDPRLHEPHPLEDGNRCAGTKHHAIHDVCDDRPPDSVLDGVYVDDRGLSAALPTLVVARFPLAYSVTFIDRDLQGAEEWV